MKTQGEFKYFIDEKEVLYKDLQTMIRLDMTVNIDGLNVYYSSPEEKDKPERSAYSKLEDATISPKKVKDRLILAEEFKKKAIDEMYFKNHNFKKEQVSQACYTNSDEVKGLIRERLEQENSLKKGKEITDKLIKKGNRNIGSLMTETLKILIEEDLKTAEKENKKEETVNRLIEEELERQDYKQVEVELSGGLLGGEIKADWIDFIGNSMKRGKIIKCKPSGTIGIEEITKIMTEGKKENDGKPQLSVLFTQFPKALEAIAKCSEYGHLKYKETDADYLNYQRVEGGSKTYADAGLRHRLYKKGTTDIESQLPHYYHVAWNALAELELLIKEN